MPQPKQDEYRSLKEQIIQLEKKKSERKGDDNVYVLLHVAGNSTSVIAPAHLYNIESYGVCQKVCKCTVSMCLS